MKSWDSLHERIRANWQMAFLCPEWIKRDTRLQTECKHEDMNHTESSDQLDTSQVSSYRWLQEYSTVDQMAFLRLEWTINEMLDYKQKASTKT